MRKSIYKITNLVNGKVYIGQSIDPLNRFKGHICGKKKDVSKIHAAIKKYGVENFSLEILDEMVENYNEREKYWIAQYNSNQREYGYNITEGGENPPIRKGDQSSFAIYSEDVIRNVQQDLIDGIKSYDEISQTYGISHEYLSILNRGMARYNPELNYPLRENGNEVKSSTLVSAVAYDLNNTVMSISEIARNYNIAWKTVSEINVGSHRNCPTSYGYPIRPHFNRLSPNIIDSIICDLRGSTKKMKQIEEDYGVSHCTVSRINRGIIYHNANLDYPIRKSSERVY